MAAALEKRLCEKMQPWLELVEQRCDKSPEQCGAEKYVSEYVHMLSESAAKQRVELERVRLADEGFQADDGAAVHETGFERGVGGPCREFASEYVASFGAI